MMGSSFPCWKDDPRRTSAGGRPLLLTPPDCGRSVVRGNRVGSGHHLLFYRGWTGGEAQSLEKFCRVPLENGSSSWMAGGIARDSGKSP